MFQRCCARFPAVVHASQKSRTFRRSCARFTSPIIMSVFDCIGATKRVFRLFIIYLLFIICSCFYSITYLFFFFTYLFFSCLFLFIDCSMCLMLDTDWCGPPPSTILRYSINRFLFLF